MYTTAYTFEFNVIVVNIYVAEWIDNTHSIELKWMEYSIKYKKDVNIHHVIPFDWHRSNVNECSLTCFSPIYSIEISIIFPFFPFFSCKSIEVFPLEIRFYELLLRKRANAFVIPIHIEHVWMPVICVTSSIHLFVCPTKMSIRNLTMSNVGILFVM